MNDSFSVLPLLPLFISLGGNSALEDITEEDAKAALSRPGSIRLHGMKSLEEEGDGDHDDDGHDQKGGGEGLGTSRSRLRPKPQPMSTPRMSAKEALAMKVSASITSMNLSLPSDTVYGNNDGNNDYGYFMNSARSGMNSARSSVNGANVSASVGGGASVSGGGGSGDQLALGYTSSDSNELGPDIDSRSFGNSGYGSDPMMKVLHGSLDRHRRPKSSDKQDTPRKLQPQSSSQSPQALPHTKASTSISTTHGSGGNLVASILQVPSTAISQIFGGRNDMKGETENTQSQSPQPSSLLLSLPLQHPDDDDDDAHNFYDQSSSSSSSNTPARDRSLTF